VQVELLLLHLQQMVMVVVLLGGITQQTPVLEQTIQKLVQKVLARVLRVVAAVMVALEEVLLLAGVKPDIRVVAVET
jgi:hypothetical protein